MAERVDRLGVCSWSLRPQSPRELAESMRALGLTAVQLAIDPVAESSDWAKAREVFSGEGISVISGMFRTSGEDYSTLESIRRTGGVVPDEHWAENLKNVRRNARIAAEFGMGMVGGHAGFISSDSRDAIRGKLLERIATIADVFAEEFGGTLLLETGQETAETLRSFLSDLGRDNVAVNFDPANMILYGMGDPVEAANQLGGSVRQVHLKDARRSDQPGEWGKEVPIGAGEVDWPSLLSTLERRGFSGFMMFERESGENRDADISTGKRFIEDLLEY